VIKGLHEASPRSLILSKAPCHLEKLSQVRSTEEGHAEQPQPRCLINMNRIDRHDMGVLQAGEYPGLVSFGERDLDGNQAPPQVHFFRQEDPGKRPATELQDDVKSSHLVADSKLWPAPLRSPRPPVSSLAHRHVSQAVPIRTHGSVLELA
jgi:hypothetical protein